MGLSQRYNAAETERRWQQTWAESQLYAFDATDPRPIFAIDTPPPTVSGEIHIGHVYSYVQAEAMARFWRMQGYNVYYPFGFDDNGLPTERYVEKTRGVRARDLPRDEFIRMCLNASRAVEDRFETFWKSLGFSADWRLRYSTIDPQARRLSQWSFLDLYRKGHIYRAQAPNPWCIECQTAIAQAEMDDTERETVFYTLAFTASGEHSATLLPIATTRPELLPACVAVFVHPDDSRYAALVGKQARVPLSGRSVPILADSAVDPAKGSGAVMCCTFGDATDVRWWQTHALPLIPLLTRTGQLSSAGGAYAGLSLAEARRRILADLAAQGQLLGQQSSRQSVRIHDRCKTPLEILETRQWFVRVLAAKDALLAAGRAITWHPAHMQARYEHWVANLGWDWCISRQRFYGVPFPVWHCAACGGIVLADETQLPADPTTDAPPHACVCGNPDLQPETDVMDTWATSSVSPQIAALRWDDVAGERQNMPLGERAQATLLRPMQLRPQAHDIIRTWAFYTIVKSHYHFGALPWETVMISGHGLDAAGRSIHKSLGNAPIAPEALIARHSADAVRYWACNGSVGADQSIDEMMMKQGTRLANKLWSAARLIEAHSGGQGQLRAEAQPIAFDTLEWADRALLAWLQELIAHATASFRSYDYASALAATERFFWHTFCDNYLEWVKGRLYDGSPAERSAAQATLARTFATILKLLAPILPHVTEEIYMHLFAGDARSIHTSAWPQADPALRNPDAEQLGEALLAITLAVRRFKSTEQIGLGAPLSRLTITATSGLCAQLEQCSTDIRSVSRAQTLAFTNEPGVNSIEAAPGLWIAIER